MGTTRQTPNRASIDGDIDCYRPGCLSTPTRTDTASNQPPPQISDPDLRKSYTEGLKKHGGREDLSASGSPVAPKPPTRIDRAWTRRILHHQRAEYLISTPSPQQTATIVHTGANRSFGTKRERRRLPGRHAGLLGSSAEADAVGLESSRRRTKCWAGNLLD